MAGRMSPNAQAASRQNKEAEAAVAPPAQASAPETSGTGGNILKRLGTHLARLAKLHGASQMSHTKAAKIHGQMQQTHQAAADVLGKEK